MNINIYRNASDNKKVRKSLSLIRESVDCQITEPCSIEAPELILSLSNNFANMNYLYIPDWDRYYYINDKSIIEGGFLRLRCKIDVLMSFFSSCMGSNIIASRSTSDPDFRIEDPEILNLPDPEILFKKTNLLITNSSSNNYVLTLSGK